jgi:hypothetical protein
MTTFVIDDLRNFRDDRPAVVARTSADALAYLEANQDAHFTDIWFDHDLGEPNGELDTTMPVVNYLSERAFYDNPVNVDIVYVHTSNPVGARQIVASLERFGYNVKKVPAEVHFIV